MKSGSSRIAVVLAALGSLSLAPALALAADQAVPAPTTDEAPSAAPQEVAVFAGGCFWGVQGVFQHVKGVTNAVSGYTGGAKETAHYTVVGSNSTGHAESVQVTFDPKQVTYGTLLRVFFSVAHDPTELNRQGPDVGTQYRSAIFPMSDQQASVAKAYIAQLDQAHVFDAPIATTIEPGKTFYTAEGSHQNYLTLHPDQPYIAYNDLPKIGALHKAFPTLYRGDPVLVASTQ